MIKVKSIVFWSFVLLSIAMLYIATSTITMYRRDLPPEIARAEVANVDSTLLEILSGEFKGLLSDYMLLKAAIVIGGDLSQLTRKDWEAVYSLYKLSVALDPYSYQNAYYVQGNLAWIDGMASRAIDLIKITVEHRPWHWEPKWYVAFDYFEYLHDKANAEIYMTEAAKTPGAPPVVAFLAARLVSREGRQNTLAALTMLKAMHELSDREEYKKTLETRIRAYEGLYQIEQAISAYQKKYKHFPSSIEDLVTSGVLTSIPKNPYGESFIYDSETGAVFLDQRHF